MTFKNQFIFNKLLLYATKFLHDAHKYKVLFKHSGMINELGMLNFYW